MQDNKGHISKGEKDDVDQAAANYLYFLQEGRKIILQDAAILQDTFPNHKLFKLPCFKSPPTGSQGTELQQKWAEFKLQVIAAHNRGLEESLQVRHDAAGFICCCMHMRTMYTQAHTENSI